MKWYNLFMEYNLFIGQMLPFDVQEQMLLMSAGAEEKKWNVEFSLILAPQK